MDGRPTWTDCDGAEDYVVPYVLSPRDLVFRPDNMDETVPHNLKYEPGAATVELRFKPRPQSTTIQPECFKRFKTAVACLGGSRITNILLELLQYYYDSRRFIYSVATNHTDASRFDKSGVNLSSRGAKDVNV